MAPKAKNGAKAPAQAEVDDDDDIIAKLDAQAEQIGEMLEKRIDEIDSHWRHSGGVKPGAVPKSGVQAKAAAQAQFESKAKAAQPEPKAKAAHAQPESKAMGASNLAAPKSLGSSAKAPTTKKDAEEEDDDDYDPFSEEPAAHLIQAALAPSGIQALQAQLAGGGAAATPIPPWRQAPKRPEFVMPASGVSLAELKGMGAPPARAVFVDQVTSEGRPQGKAFAKAAPPGSEKGSGKGKSIARMNVAANIATQYFKPVPGAKASQPAPGAAGAPAAKRQKVEATVQFAKELLDKAPDSVQTCRSLLLFLDKKLEAPHAEAPKVGGPQDLRLRLEAHADALGRSAGLKSSSWDARAKRVLDLGAARKTPAAEALLVAFDKKLAEAEPVLETALLERGEGIVEKLCGERRTWAEDKVRLDWFLWCGRLLRAKEAALLESTEGKDATSEATTGGLGSMAVFEKILTADAGLRPTNAGI